MTNQNQAPNALTFALLIGSVPELDEGTVTAAYLAATAAWRRRDDRAMEEIEAGLSAGIVKTRAEIGDFEDDDLSRALGAPVGDRQIVKPIQKANTAALSLAVDRFVSFTKRLPHLGTWDDRQAVWNLLPGSRPEPTPVTNCETAHAARRAS